MDPEAEHTRERDRLEGLNGTLPDRVRTTVKHFSDVLDDQGFQLRFHEVHLYAGLYRFDDQMILTPYLVGANGYQHPALHLQRLGPHGIFEQYAAQIERIWSRAHDRLASARQSV